MVECVGDPVLRLARSEVERVQHVERAGELFARVRFPFKGPAGLEHGFPNLLGSFLASLRADGVM